MSVKEHEPPKKPLIYYSTVALVVLLLLNIFVFPLLFNNRVTEVDYNDFLAMVDAGEVEEVARDDNAKTITFTAHNGKDGRLRYYQTGIWPDDTLLTRLESANVKFTSSIPTQASPLLTILLSWVLPILIFSFIGKLLMGRMTSGGAIGNAMSFGKANAKIYVEAQTGKTFADVAGEDEAKEALQEIVNFLHEPAKYAEIGAKLPKGALLVGPPGTGKTLLARAVAGEAKVPFFSISGSDFVEMFVGMGAAKVRDLFKQADEKAPCIVFIDEIDTIGKKRDSGFSSNDEREQTLNQLLTEMDGFDPQKGVVILAATNRPDTLDPALLRPGRFDRRIPVELPDLNGRIAILKVHSRDVKMSGDINFEVIARATSGASGAELANIINEAALRAVKLGRDTVIQEDLEESVETVIAGYQRKGAVVSPKEKRIVAYHEIGHALVAAKQSNSAPVHKITIVPRTSGALGYTMQVEEGEKLLMTKSQDEIMDLLYEYVPEYDALGKSMGEKLLEGFQSRVGSITDWFRAFNDQLARMQEELAGHERRHRPILRKPPGDRQPKRAKRRAGGAADGELLRAGRKPQSGGPADGGRERSAGVDDGVARCGGRFFMVK